jgi:hypothetical protein
LDACGLAVRLAVILDLGAALFFFSGMAATF